jgi:hypothetical protein
MAAAGLGYRGPREVRVSPESLERIRLGGSAALVANLLVLGVITALGWLEARDADSYYRMMQEDEALEWATFWAFAAAGAACWLAARRQQRAQGGVPWFLAGVGLFCFVVALEEISWGQRLLGYRPPVYFLERNFQQELNVHNVVDTALRKLALDAVLLGYGVVLPFLAGIPRLGARLGRLGVVAPPRELAPVFLAAFGLYHFYPWEFSGEIVECVLGIGFLFAALAAAAAFAGPAPSRRSVRAAALAGAAAAVAVLGFAQAALSRQQRSASPENVEAARVEVEALRRDFVTAATLHRDGGSTCGTHQRLYGYLHDRDADWLTSGSFVRLVERGLPEERADFLLDPWNSPYWIRDRCDDATGRRVAFVYSLGPNRRRDSSPWEIRGDDVGTVILRLPGAAVDRDSPTGTRSPD